MAITRSAKASLGSNQASSDIMKAARRPTKAITRSTQPASRSTVGAGKTSNKSAATPAAATTAASRRTAAAEDLPTLPFADAAAFEAYLATHHASAPGVYVQLAKKASGLPSVSAAEGVEVALCYGWIDGRANSIDDTWWTVRYVPRRPRSIWSKKNVDTVGRLIIAGRMTPAGLAEVDAAKADGRWARAYSGPATIVVPADFEAQLHAAGNEVARGVFEGLNRTDRYAVLFRIETTRSDAGRKRKITELVEMLGRGEVPGREARAKYQKKGK